MSVNLTVIGLHQVGASIGWALNQYKDKLTCTGYSEERLQSKKIEKLKIFTRIENNFSAAVKEADLVILAVPADEVHELLEIISSLLKENAQVIDTSILHLGMDEFAARTLRPDCHFISATPILNPAYLDEESDAIDEPHVDLFKNGALLICNGSQTHPDMIKVAADLAQLLGSHAYFTDPLEADAILTEVEILPKLISAALVNTTITNPGWNDGSRLAGKAYLKSTVAVQYLDETNELGKAALNVRENTLRSLDGMAAKIAEIRSAVERNDAVELKELLENAKKGREDWLKFKSGLDWNSPTGIAPTDRLENSRNLFWRKPKAKGK